VQLFNNDILQDNVETAFRSGRKFHDSPVANFLPNLLADLCTLWTRSLQNQLGQKKWLNMSGWSEL